MSIYAEVAQVALNAPEFGLRPAQAVADHFGCTETAARNKIHKARRAGFDIPFAAPVPTVPVTPAVTIMYDPMPWKQYAACWDSDPSLFFPERGQDTSEAKKICAACSCRLACLQYALDNEIKYGIWGGVSEAQRRKMRRQVRRGAA